jgi:hypothetical protein
VHRRNAAERAIRTFKDHFIASLCSLDQAFPLHLWDRLVPQAFITLNLLRASRFHPQLSAWAALNGNFEINRTPLAPPGIRVLLVHEKPAQRDSWSPAGTLVLLHLTLIAVILCGFGPRALHAFVILSVGSPY